MIERLVPTDCMFESCHTSGLIFSSISDVSLQKEVGSMLRVGSNNADRPALRIGNASFEVAGSVSGTLPFRCS